MNSNRQIPAFEATSLTNKFKQLWLTGTEAKLVFETRAGKAWGTLHVCLGEHPHDATQLPPQPQEHSQGRDTPSKRRRRERREAAMLAQAAVVKAATRSEKEAEEAFKTEKESVIAEEAVTLNSESEQSKEVTEEESRAGMQGPGPLLTTEIDDEICSDEEYYDEIDPGAAAFTCLQCKIEHFPGNFVEGEKVLFYGLCRWHLGVYRCNNCSKNIIGLGNIRVHRQICRAPS